MNALKAKTNEIMSLFSARFEVEGHVLRANNAMHTSKCKLNLLIDSIVHTQIGVLYPQIISPFTLIQKLIKNISALLKETTLHTLKNKDSAQFLVRLYELQVYIKISTLAVLFSYHL